MQKKRFLNRAILACIVAFLGIIAIILFAATLFLNEDRKYPNRETNAQIANAGEPILRALEAYKTKHGSYPGNLYDLVPDFLPRIPAAPFGTREWTYRAYHKSGTNVESYELRVLRRGNYYEGYYSLGDGTWSYDS